jgi:hypothetical protein
MTELDRKLTKMVRPRNNYDTNYHRASATDARGNKPLSYGFRSSLCQ